MHSVLSVDSLGFIGQASVSPKKRWVVGCTDRQPGMNPSLGEADGSVVLVDYQADCVVLQLSGVHRPMDSAVSDAGFFLFNDLDSSGALSSNVQAFNADGVKLFTRRYEANVYNLAISSCGRYGVVQTCNAPNDDGNLLEVLDLLLGTTVFSREPESGWAEQYAFGIDEKGTLTHLSVIHKEIGRFDYSATGEFLDTAKHQKARWQKGSAEMRIHGAKTALKANPQDRALAQELLSALDSSLTQLGMERTDWLAIGLRVKGEALELLGRTAEAIDAYETAIAADPKIGVAKRLAKLKKASKG